MFSCLLCVSSFQDIHAYNKHQRRHATDLNLQILCLYPKCKKIYDRYGSFKQHVYRCHAEKARVFQFTCTQTNCDFKCQNNKIFTHHFYRHFEKSHNGVFCSYPDCPNPNREFLTKNAFSLHVSRIHSWQKMSHGSSSLTGFEKQISEERNDETSLHEGVIDDNVGITQQTSEIGPSSEGAKVTVTQNAAQTLSSFNVKD